MPSNMIFSASFTPPLVSWYEIGRNVIGDMSLYALNANILYKCTECFVFITRWLGGLMPFALYTTTPLNDYLGQRHILQPFLPLWAIVQLCDPPLLHSSQFLLEEAILAAPMAYHQIYLHRGPLVRHMLFPFDLLGQRGSTVSLITLWGLLAPLDGACTRNAYALYKLNHSFHSELEYPPYNL